MKLRLHHRLLAHFPAVLAQIGGIALASAVSAACAPIFQARLDFLSAAAFVLALAAAYGLGALVAVAFFGRLLYPLVARAAGAPFSIGDRVVILHGVRAGIIAQIYEVWSARGQVRLRLSAEESRCATDVYSYHQVLRSMERNKPLEQARIAHL